jgi:predicted Zn-dependent protease
MSSAELDLAGRVVEIVRRVAGAEAEAEVIADHTALALTRFANSRIHQNVADATTTVRLRLHVDGRTAAGASTVVDADGLAGLVERTLAAARLCPPDPGWAGLAPPEPVGPDDAWDETTAQASAEVRADRVRAFVDAAGGLETAGYCRTVHWSTGFANTGGQAVTGRSTEAAMDGIARLGGGVDGVARLASRRLADLDGAVLGARAAIKARAGADPAELAPGRYEVVLESAAVADLLQNFAFFGFNGKLFNERQSFAELGTAQFDSAVSLVDDHTLTGGIGVPFDAEGTPKRRVAFVDKGVTGAVAHDRRTAKEAGPDAVSTGHAMADAASWGAIPWNLRLEPSGDVAEGPVTGPVADAQTAALVSTMERGLLVTDFWYTRVLDPKTLVVTGLTRNGVWLVEDGEITGAVRNFRFTQSYPQALGPGQVLGIGGTALTMPDSWGSFGFTGPAVRLASWNFTGGASG